MPGFGWCAVGHASPATGVPTVCAGRPPTGQCPAGFRQARPAPGPRASPAHPGSGPNASSSSAVLGGRRRVGHQRARQCGWCRDHVFDLHEVKPRPGRCRRPARRHWADRVAISRATVTALASRPRQPVHDNHSHVWASMSVSSAPIQDVLAAGAAKRDRVLRGRHRNPCPSRRMGHHAVDSRTAVDFLSTATPRPWPCMVRTSTRGHRRAEDRRWWAAVHVQPVRPAGAASDGLGSWRNTYRVWGLAARSPSRGRRTR